MVGSSSLGMHSQSVSVTSRCTLACSHAFLTLAGTTWSSLLEHASNRQHGMKSLKFLSRHWHAVSVALQLPSLLPELPKEEKQSS